MNRKIRVIVLNSDESYTVELRSKLLMIDRVKIVAEVDEPALFPSVLAQFSAELAIIHLDREIEDALAVTQKIHEHFPNLCLLAVSDTNDPDLIRAAMRAGVREFLVKPVETNQLAEAIEHVTKTAKTSRVIGKLIAIVGPNGGCGATTLATNLGCELAQMSPKGTVIADLDFAFGHVATILDMAPQFTIADLSETLDSIDPEMMKKALVRHDCGALVLARPQQFAQSEQISAANTANVLNTLCEMHDYVVCDGPPRYDGSGGAVLDMADMTIMLVNPVVSSLRNAERILEELLKQGYNPDRLRLVVNRFRTDGSTLGIQDIEKCLSRNVDFIIPDDPLASLSGNVGQPLLSCAPKSKVREAIRRLAKQIDHPEMGGNHSRKGIFSKIFGTGRNELPLRNVS
jgi:pilus assembly protein CpaE